MGSIRSRLDQLEAAAGGTALCPDCGWCPDLSKVPRENVRFEIILPGHPNYDREPEPCPTCGRTPRRFTIELDRQG